MRCMVVVVLFEDETDGWISDHSRTKKNSFLTSPVLNLRFVYVLFYEKSTYIK
jgi:hypothetical protein